MVFAKIGIHDPARAAVDNGLFVQRKGYAPNHPAEVLAPHQMRIDDAAGGKSANHAGDADLAEIGIDLDLGKDRAVRAHRVGGLGGRIHRAIAACSISARPARPRMSA